ncbi:MAG: IPT/TIG domain-containing protein, partial [Chloroflexota bacterium]|nr:IPT/TIG domain-containing protein [Chloroflexota bacterium]
MYSLTVAYQPLATAPNFNAATAQPVTLTITNPVPAISSLSPTSAQAGASGTVTLTGSGFVPGSIVTWAGANVATSFVSPTQLSVTIPNQSVQAPDIAVINTAPGGGMSNGAVFFFTQNGAQATVASGTSTRSSGSASVKVAGRAPFSAGSLTGEAIGAGTLTLAQYSAMPVNAPSFGPEGGWFDVHVSAGNSFSSMTVIDCNMGQGHFAYWWTGTAWQIMSNQTYDIANGCNTITFTATTSPSISQLNGTSAEVWAWSIGIGLPPCIGDEFVGDHGGRLPQTLDELNGWGNSTGLRDSGGNWHCSPTLAAPQSPPAQDGWYQRSIGGIIQGWDDMDSQLRGANYPGPYDHDGDETAAYQRACLCTLTPYTPPPPVVCSSGYYMTINGAKTVDQMRSELHVAGYPNWYWASEAEIVGVYARVSGGLITLCAVGDPQPGTTPPTPTPNPDPTPNVQLVVQNPTVNPLTLSWSPGIDPSYVSSYTVYYEVGDQGQGTLVTLLPNIASINVYVGDNTDYQFSVSATTTSGKTGSSAAIPVHTLLAQPPAQDPTDLPDRYNASDSFPCLPPTSPHNLVVALLLSGELCGDAQVQTRWQDEPPLDGFICVGPQMPIVGLANLQILSASDPICI